MVTRAERLRKGMLITVQYHLADVAKPFLTARGNKVYCLLCDAIVLGEKVCYNSSSFLHVWQIHEDSPDQQIVRDVKIWPRLQKALHKCGEKSFVIPSDALPVSFADEMAVADFSDKYKGSERKYFLIKRTDISKYLLTVPLDKDGERLKREFDRKGREENERQEIIKQLETGKIVPEGWSVTFGKTASDMTIGELISGESLRGEL